MRTCALLLCAGALASAQERHDLATIPLEDLMQLEVTSAARKPQALARTAAAVSVITREDIRRSGLTSVPEVLRLAPGVQVARIDASRWAIAVRGFNGRMSDKLLVLVDGRSVYTSLYGGVYWDVQDLLVEDIERIEVIRGPGGVMWGANAVNGVINIITRPASETVGGLLSAAGGNQEQGVASLRYGARVAPGVHARIWSRRASRGQFRLPEGGPAGDAWRLSRAGARLDWSARQGHSVLIETDFFSTRSGDPEVLSSLTPPYAVATNDPTRDAGGSLLARWTKTSDRSETSVEFSFSRLRHRETRVCADMQLLEWNFQQRFRRGGHELLWGGEFRRASDHIRNSPDVVFTPAAYADPLFSGFLQDDWSLADNRLVLTAGLKLEDSSYTGTQLAPSLRLLWAPTEHRAAWAAVSRAVRSPARADRDAHLAQVVPGTLPTLLELLPNPQFGEEELVSWEGGYRMEWSARLSLDAAAFYNSYHHLKSLLVGTPSFAATPPHLVVPMQYHNRLRATALGAELAIRWQLLPRWRLDADYSWLNIHLDPATQPSDVDIALNAGGSPRHQAHLQSYFDLTRQVQLDTGLFYVAGLRGLQVPAYLRADLRLGWRPHANLEFSLAGQNLLDSRHPEFWGLYEGVPRLVEVGRSASLQVTWRFP